MREVFSTFALVLQMSNLTFVVQGRGRPLPNVTGSPPNVILPNSVAFEFCSNITYKIQTLPSFK